MEPTYASNYRVALARWDGVGDNSWFWNNQVTSTASLDYSYNPHTYRCVFHDILY